MDEDNQSSNDNDDYEECEGEEAEDDEATLDEEDDLNGGHDYKEELKELEEENELSVEELRKKYYGEEEKDMKRGEEWGKEKGGKEEIGTETDQTTTSSTLTRNMRGKIVTAFATTCETITKYFRAEDLEEDDSEDYMPPEMWKKEIRIGPEFQVSGIPDASKSDKSECNRDGGELEWAQALWVAVPERCPESRVVEYLVECEQIRAGEKLEEGQSTKKRAKNCASMAMTVKAHETVPDDENALLALYRADYDLNKAKSQAPFDLPALCSCNGPRLTQSSGQWKIWSEEECKNFEKGIMENGKNFWKIHRDFLPNRTLGEIVCFYYSWKKTERHDVWRAEKNKRDQQMDVKTADLMGQIAESILQGKNASEGTVAGIPKKGTTPI